MKSLKEVSFLLNLHLLLFLFFSGTWANIPGLEEETPGMGQAENTSQVPARMKAFTKRLRFEPNMGQTGAPVRFLSRGYGYTLFLMPDEAFIALKNAKSGESSQKSCSSVRMQLIGANPAPHITGRDILPGITNYYIGNNPDNWHTNIVNYARVEYQDIYTGIDLVYYGKEGLLEYDFVVSPGGDPQDILMNIITNEKIRLDKQGNLVISGENNTMILKRPVAYQDINGNREPVDVAFAFAGKNQLRFVLGKYDPRYSLIIDPILIFFSYFGGSGYDNGSAIAVDTSGCAYITGTTYSTDLPVRKSFQSNKFPGFLSSSTDVFVTKFNPEGTDIVYSTYIGGRLNESGNAIAVHENGQVCITGQTGSDDDPETPEYDGFPLKNSCQTEMIDNADAFVTVLDSSGGLAYSTYLGGKYDDYGVDIAVDISGNVYVTGNVFSFDFPIKNAFMDKIPSYYYATFITKIDPTKSGDESLVYSTFLGGEGDDDAKAIAVDRYGCAYVTGMASWDFPTTENSIQPVWQGDKDAYVTKLSADGSSLVYSTYLGDDKYNYGRDIAVDDSCCAYVCGNAPIPATPGALNNPGSGFLCKLNPSGNGFVYAAHVNISTIALDKNGNIFGSRSYGPGEGGGLLAFNSEGTDTLFEQRISLAPSDLALYADSSIYIVGTTDSAGLATENAYQTSPAGNKDAYIARYKLEPREMLIVKVMSDPIYDMAVPVTNTLLDIYSIDLSNRASPLVFIESMTTDKKGLLHLPADSYQPGTPIFIRVMPEKKPAVKQNRTEKTSYLYKVYVDNLIFDNDGNISAQYLESDPADTTVTYMSHTSIGFSLIVSIQWLASQGYVTNLVNALTEMNNRLYDVTNGHAFIDTVAIYDNADHWDDADIKIKAENTQWPCAVPDGIAIDHKRASVSLPPVWDGRPETSMDVIYNTDPVNPAISDHIMTITHELGHYIFGFFDEYINKAKDHIFPNINFGFMDSQYNLNDPRSTEMSDFYVVGDTMFEHYQQTAQYQIHGRNCWDYLRYKYWGIYGDIIANIHTPEDLGISSNDVMKGPNSDILNPDFSVGDMMGFELNATTTTNPRLDVLITVSPSGLGRVIPGAQTKLHKKGMAEPIHHGLTNGAGRIKLFNAEPGDTILATHKERTFWRYKKIVVPPAGKNTEIADMVIELETVSGQFSLLAGLAFDAAGLPVYQCYADPLFTSPPHIQVFDNISASGKQVLSVSEEAYSAVLNNTGFSEGSVFFSAPDNDGEEFFVFQDAIIRDLVENDIVSKGGLQLEYTIDTSATTAEKIALLASAFPSPLNGLPDSVLRVSDVISIDVFPNDAELKVRIQLHYFTDSLEAVVPEALTLYSWQNGWVPLETSVDFSHNMVTAVLDGSGYIAAYLDLTKSRLISHIEKDVEIEPEPGIKLLPSYPNPFDWQTTIKYHLHEPGHVVLKIYSPTGQELTTLVNAPQAEGGHEVTWQPEGLPAGLYLYRIVVTDNSSTPGQDYTKTGKMMLVR
ncbi:MAG: SBBP repeat-containing protein [Bacteroidales bacterium]|nr:SBBP repeat-containing protein [Bacteroidales bacterium]